LGHVIGDEIIKTIGDRISNSVRDVDIVARIGGDEYVVLLHEPASEAYVTDTVFRILAAIGGKLTIGDHPLYIGCSVGIALYPKDGKTPSELMMHADTAMYRAKETQKGGFCYFTKNMNERARLWLELKHDLHDAVKKGQLELYYQPQYSLKEERLIGAEALIRWNHPDHGLLSPGMFIPIAEESGLILSIGAWVVKEAVKEACRWKRKSGGLDIRLSVNISARQFRYEDLLFMLEEAVKDHHFQPFSLDLELTESMIMEDPAKASELLSNFKEKGFSLAMDDFGTGYSSLAYLRRFPFDMIKIDKSFIDDLGKNRETEAIVSAILDLGRAVGMSLIAEGVETYEQLEFLRARDCGEIQGYLYSRPLKAADFLSFLEEDKKLP
jgi:EAL domain-containing protein (putative c-di-GMP-specific phosphodiesterase class I)